MFPQFKKVNNESGIVLFIVLMTSIVIMIYSVGILTQSVNEINYAQQQIDQITSDQLAKGVFWNSYATGMAGVPGTVTEVATPVLNTGRNYVQTIVNTSGVGASIGTYQVSTNFDTFQ